MIIFNFIFLGEDISETDDYKPASPEVVVVAETSPSSVIMNTPPHQPQDITYPSNGDRAISEVVAPAVHVNNVTVSKEQMRRELAEIRKHNLDVRSKVYKEVRRPGKSKHFY